jgi:preprotein translocase subunit SecY
MSAFAGFANIAKVPELRKRLLFTIGLLAVYRIGVFITIPGVDRAALHASMATTAGGLGGLLNMFSGGARGNASVFTLGIMPYITASIAMQLLGMVFKPLEEMRKEGEQGQRKLNQYMRYATVGIALVQGLFEANRLQQASSNELGDVVLHGGATFVAMTALSFTTGTILLMWLGEQITERGIGNGTSLLIFAGIVDGIPGGVAGYVQANLGSLQPLNLAAVLAVILGTVAVIVFFERGQRRIPIYYARRIVGRRVYGGQTAHLPLKVNTAGTIGPIFASSLLALPQSLASYKIPGMAEIANAMTRGDWLSNVFYIGLIIFFCLFYTAATFPAVDLADNLKKQQAFIPSVRQGKATAEYIDRVLTRITLGGAIYVAAVCVVPTFLAEALRIPFRWGGTSIMIVVGVALDTVAQIESHLLTRNYEGLSGGGRATRVRGRRDA